MKTKTKKNYIICTPKLSNSNGVRVLHILAKNLENKGCNVCLFSVPDNKLPYKYITDITDDMRQNDIVVYPEFILGNPLKFKNVVRLILYYSGKRSIEQNFDNELVFTYERIYSPKGDLLYIPGLDETIFYNDKNIEKTENCYFVYKGGKWKDIPEFDNMTKITREYPKTRNELGDLLRKTKTLYSYDDCSLILDEAELCGCKVKIVRENGFEDYKSSYKERSKDFEKQLENFIEKTQNYSSAIPISTASFPQVVKETNYPRSLKNVKIKNKIDYYIYKSAYNIIRPINKIIAQKCWFRAETRLSRIYV